MFARLVQRSLWQRKSRALVALGALTVASTLAAALLNLYLDAQRKIRSEFRLYGANLMVTPRAPGTAAAPQLLDAELARELDRDLVPDRLAAVAPYLYAVVEAHGESVVLAGTRLDAFAHLGGFEVEGGQAPSSGGAEAAWVGTAAARRFGLKPGDVLVVRYRNSFQSLRVAGVVSTGAAEDNQILAELTTVQALTGTRGKLNVVLARANGGAAAIEQTAAGLTKRYPAVAVNPIRQVTQAEFRVVERIRWVLLGTTLVVLVVTGLCVLATMTAQALERRRTIGTMKALGATNARLSWLFLSEAAALALVAGAVGFLGGIGLAHWLGETLFAASISLRWATLPLALGVALAIALAGTLLPLRLVRQTQPAVILRGE